MDYVDAGDFLLGTISEITSIVAIKSKRRSVTFKSCVKSMCVRMRKGM